jgi:hypothetical protein
MPADMKTRCSKVFDTHHNDPKIIINAFYLIKRGLWISSSGTPDVPALETGNNYAAFKTLLEDTYGITIISKGTRIQIDDSNVFVDGAIDFEQFQKDLFDYFGFIINATKTEKVSAEERETSHLKFLQNFIGKLLISEDYTSIGGLPLTDGFIVISDIMRKVHRTWAKERISQIGDFDVKYESDVGLMTDIPRPITRWLGTTGSLGPWTPISLIDIFINHAQDTSIELTKGLLQESPELEKYGFAGQEVKFWPIVRDFVHEKSLTINVDQFGFDFRFLIEYIVKEGL